MYLNKSKIHPSQKSANKKYFTINFTHLVQKAIQILCYAIFYLPLPVSVTVSILTVNAFISLTLTPNIPILMFIGPYIILIAEKR